MILTPDHEAKHTSQNGEDGIIATILGVIGEGRRTYIEIGTEDGSECNTRALANAGWTGVMVDNVNENELVRKVHVTKDNVQSVLRELGAVEHPDVFSLDIDGNDFWVLANLGPFMPRLLVCEYNNRFADDEFVTIPYTEPFRWDGTCFYGASQRAMHWLAGRYGMALVYVEKTGTNMFFVERSLAHHFEHADKPEKLYYGTRWTHREDPQNRVFIRQDWRTMEACGRGVQEIIALGRQ